MEKISGKSSQKSNLSSPCMDGPSSTGPAAARNKQVMIKTEKDLDLNLSLNGKFGVDTSMSSSSKKLKCSRPIATPCVAINSADAAENAPTAHDHHAPAADVESVSDKAPLIRFSSWPVPYQTILDDYRNRSKEARKMRKEKMRHTQSMVKDGTNHNVHDGAGRHSRGRPSAAGRLRTAGGQQYCSNLQIKGANQVAAAAQAANGSVNARNAQPNEVASGSAAARNAPWPNGNANASNAQLPDQAAIGHANAGYALHDLAANGNATATNALLDRMPYVSTRVNGHRRVFGFLYRYNAEEVKIICVCHAMFFTPMEFVEHGCGHGVDNPLQHIWVMPFPSGT